MKQKAYTLAEQLIVIVIIGFIATIMTSTFKTSNYKIEVLQRAAKAQYVQIDFATKNLLAKHSKNYNFFTLFDESGVFSATDSSSLDRIVQLYRKVLVGKKNSSWDSTYSANELTDGTTSITGLTPSSYTGFILKNDAYFGVRLNGDCNTQIDYLFSPSTPEKKTKTKTCGTLFFDVNGEDSPNFLGIDQYIIAFGKFGVK